MTPPQEPPLSDTVPAMDRTVRLSKSAERGSAASSAASDENDSATLLADEAWGTPAATLQLPSEASLLEAPVEGDEHGLRRFGPGVPAAAQPVPELAAALWHGTVQPGELPSSGAPQPRRRARRLGWLLPVGVLLAVLGYLAWQWYAPPLTVTGVSVRTDPAGPGCGGTAVVTGTLTTDGHAGTVTYRWRRSDGTVSGELTQPVAKGSRSTDVVLRWTFDGTGTMAATAVLEVSSPTTRSASTSFTYTCR